MTSASSPESSRSPSDAEAAHFTLRLAREADVPALRALIALSTRVLQARFYSSAQIEAAIGPVFDVDQQLIRDGTYFVVEEAGQIVGCGGWSRRHAVYGGDANRAKLSGTLDPALDPARIRAFFVHPDYARRGIGRQLLRACESALQEAGFCQAMLVGTLAGEPLYASSGYTVAKRYEVQVPHGLTLPVVEMWKSFGAVQRHVGNDSEYRSAGVWPVYHGMSFFAFAAAAAAIPASRAWPLPLLLPLVAYFLVVALVPRLRRTFESPRIGSFSTTSWVAAVAMTVVSCTVLVVFDRVAQPDVGAYPAFLQVRALGGILAAGVLFSLVNPALEELIFRGLLYRAVEAQWGQLLAIGMSAALFGIAHTQGYPPGPAGALLATGYGLALGWLRAITGGLMLPIASHVAADATIFVLVARTGVFEQ